MRFFVDKKEKRFLGDLPDGTIGSNNIVKIKCFFSAKNTDTKTVVEQKLIKYLVLDSQNSILLKKKKYLYQVGLPTCN